MKLWEFNRQLNADRLRKTMHQGTYITCRFEAPCYVYLYTLDSFFVEIWHVTSTESQAWCRGFSTIDRLDPYLQKINLGQLQDRKNIG